MPDYTISVLHPQLVHFPIALLLVAAPVALAWAVRKTAFWRGATLLLLGLGAAGALAAYLTGEEMEAQAEGVPIVEMLVEKHESLGKWTLVVATGATLAVAACAWVEARRRTLPAALRWITALLVLAAAGLAAWTGHLGGLMVWGVPA